ncbi:MAG: response regulator [Cyclobacteriaceae bacterium]|nr:response regulator [Cyclobacteriaceae bacterium]
MNLKALIVEDDLVVQFLNKKLLNSINIEADIVSNGFEALMQLKKSTYDFVLMDINMPEQDGLDTARWIRDEQDTVIRAIPIFALTSFATEEHTQEIKDAGINEHLSKPLSVELLVKILHHYFQVPSL